jgi:transposase InsO family protein
LGNLSDLSPATTRVSYDHISRIAYDVNSARNKYAAAAYREALEAHGITCSMSRRGNCWDNAVAESFFGRLKVELGDFWTSEGAAQRDLEEYIDVFYNFQRLHSHNGYLTPAEMERSARQLAA